MTISSNKGGARKGAGRPRRTEEKSKPVWVGQLTDEERSTIIDSLSPDERKAALLMAALEKHEVRHQETNRS